MYTTNQLKNKKFKSSDLDLSEYQFYHMVNLGYFVNEGDGYVLGKELPDAKTLQLEIALSNYRKKHPDKDRRQVVTKELMNEWLETLFIQDGVFPVTAYLKEVGAKNIRYVLETLKELEYIVTKKGSGSEILKNDYEVDDIYTMYCQKVKNHSKKYKNSKRSYNTYYG